MIGDTKEGAVRMAHLSEIWLPGDRVAYGYYREPATVVCAAKNMVRIKKDGKPRETYVTPAKLMRISEDRP